MVHNLPVVADIRRRFPDSRIDWAVEEAYAGLVELHPALRRAIPVAIRRWRRQLLGASTWAEIGALRREVREERYDAVIDSQGLIKSALLARAASGRRHGLDAGTAREALAARFYDVRHHIPNGQHAVARNRLLAAAALGYRVDGPIEYGVRVAEIEPGRGAYCALLHMSSRSDKLWPEAHWIDLGRELERRGFTCVLLWGTNSERQRSARIAAGLERAQVPERKPLVEVARLLAGARAVIGIDTGLTHLAAALGVPAVALFSGSDPMLTGVIGAARARNLGGPGTTPAVDEVLGALLGLQAI